MQNCPHNTNRFGQNTVSSCRNNASMNLRESDPIMELPVGSKKELMNYIQEISFAAYDTALYLDTHPHCSAGKEYYEKCNRRRALALLEYAKRFGPLTLDQVHDCECGKWNWKNQPWPWEGGNC